MPTKPYPKDKSPLHPSALRLQDLNPGKTIVRHNKRFANSDTYTVASKPFIGYLGSRDGQTPRYKGQTKALIVILRDSDGSSRAYSLADMGVTPYGVNHWNVANFAVDARKRHLLPKEPTLEPPAWDDYWDDDVDDMCYAHQA